MVFMILGIICTLAGVIVLVKYVTLIHKTNNKVISLFGMIKAVDIRGLLVKCEEFAEKYMENSLKQREKEKQMSYGGPSLVGSQPAPPPPEKPKNTEEDQSYMLVNGNNPTDNQGDNKLDVSVMEDKNNKTNTSIMTKESYNNTTLVNTLKNKDPTNASKIKPPQVTLLPPPLKSALATQNKSTKAEEGKKNELAKAQRKEEEDALKAAKPDENASQANRDEIRQRRLMNTVDNNTKLILIQFSIFIFMFWAYFIADYAFITVFLGQVRNCYSHLELIAERPSIVKYRIVFTYENIATSKKQIQLKNIFNPSEGKVDVWEDYRDQMYNNEINIFNSLKISYPTQFDEYSNDFHTLNYGDVCSDYFRIFEPTRYSGIFFSFFFKFKKLLKIDD